MKKRSYHTPVIDVVAMSSCAILDDGYSENTKEAPVIDDGELDANSSQLFEDTSHSSLWDD